MRKFFMIVVPLGVLAACDVSPPEPAVSQYNGDSVTIQIDSSLAFLGKSSREAIRKKMQNKADEICRRGHRKRAEYVSERYTATSNYSGFVDVLYLCLD